MAATWTSSIRSRTAPNLRERKEKARRFFFRVQISENPEKHDGTGHNPPEEGV